jgi:hypothetical protein
MQSPVLRKRYAVLFDLDAGPESVPLGLVVERPDHVRVVMPPEQGIKERFDDEERQMQMDGTDAFFGPGDPRYFPAILDCLHRAFLIGYLGEYGEPYPDTQGTAQQSPPKAGPPDTEDSK